MIAISTTHKLLVQEKPRDTNVSAAPSYLYKNLAISINNFIFRNQHGFLPMPIGLGILTLRI